MDNLYHLYKEEFNELFEIQKAYWDSDMEIQKNLVVREQSICGLLNSILSVCAEKDLIQKTHLNQNSQNMKSIPVQKQQYVPTEDEIMLEKQFNPRSAPITPLNRLAKVYNPKSSVSKNDTKTSPTSLQMYSQTSSQSRNTKMNDSPLPDLMIPHPPIQHYSPIECMLPPAPPASPTPVTQ